MSGYRPLELGCKEDLLKQPKQEAQGLDTLLGHLLDRNKLGLYGHVATG